MTNAGAIALIIAFYFLPTMVAILRGRANGWAGIALVNLIFGMTVIGWLVAFIWAWTGPAKGDLPPLGRA
jgi:T4 superinfection immunity protein